MKGTVHLTFKNNEDCFLNKTAAKGREWLGSDAQNENAA
jgi:hypothetical protein